VRQIFKSLMIALVLSAFSLPALAQERSGNLAVMDMSFSGQGLAKKEVDLLCGDIREKAVELTSCQVMTRENVLAVLREKKMDLLKCSEVECEVQFGKIIQANKLVTSSLLLKRGVYYLRIRFYDVPSGSIEKTVNRECKAGDFSALRKSVQDAAREVLGGGARAPEKVKEAPGSASQRAPLKEAKPTEAVEAVPGVLTVEVTPVKAKVTINGQEMGETPFTVKLQAGDYIIKVTANGYKSGEKRVTIKSNSPVILSFALENEPLPSPPPPSQELMNKTNNAMTVYEWYNKGVRLNNNSDEEMAYYREAIRSDSTFAPPYYNLGQILYHRGMKQEAIEDFEKYINYTKDPAEKARVQDILSKIRDKL
jgi:hypothetical protein